MALFSAVHEEQREPVEGQSTLTHCQSVWHCVMIIRITSSRIMEPKHIQASVCESLRMALSAVNILHLNGPLEAKQTQTGLHTNDRRGPGVRQGTRHVSV